MSEEVSVKPESSIEEEKKQKKKKRFKKRLRDLIIKVTVLVVGLYVLLTYIFGLYVVHDNNMYPSLRDGDLVITYRLMDRYNASHVFAYELEGKIYFGRIVGVAGDVIDITADGYLKVNGKVPYEDHFYDTNKRETFEIVYPYTVGEGKVFMLGDYRTEALDSRLFGAIQTNELRGEVVLTLRRRGF